MVVGDGSSADLLQATAEFVAIRGRLFGIAYRMLGSRTEAEDIVQEAWLRWQNYDRNTVVDPPAFLPRRPRACVSMLCSRRVRGAKPTSAHGFPSPWWAPSVQDGR